MWHQHRNPQLLLTIPTHPLFIHSFYPTMNDKMAASFILSVANLCLHFQLVIFYQYNNNVQYIEKKQLRLCTIYNQKESF